MIKFTQNAWLKPYIDMNTDLRKKAKTDFEKDFFKLMNKVVFEKNRTKLSYYKVFHRKVISSRNEKKLKYL